MTFERITVDPSQMDGVPCIRGLRIPVATVVRSQRLVVRGDSCARLRRTALKFTSHGFEKE